MLGQNWDRNSALTADRSRYGKLYGLKINYLYLHLPGFYENGPNAGRPIIHELTLFTLMINAGAPWQDGGCPKKPRQPEPSGGNSQKLHEILPSYYHSLCTSRFGNSWSPLNKKPSYCQRGKYVYEKITEIYIPPELQLFSRDSTKPCYLVDQIQLTHWYWKQPIL